MAKLLSDNGNKIYATTIHKMEVGDRAVRVEEAVAIADLFEVSVNALTGAGSTGEQDDLAYLLHSVRDAARVSGLQVSGIASEWFTKMQSLAVLDFEGRDDAVTDAARAWHSLDKATHLLAKMASLTLPPDANLTLGTNDGQVTFKSAIDQLDQLGEGETDETES